MEERKIQPGDIVRLKLGPTHREMIVEFVGQNVDAVPYFQCMWHDTSGREHHDTYYPATLIKVNKEEEYVITYIIILFINYENLRREQEGEPKMTEEEEEKVRESLSSAPFPSRIREMAEAVRNGVVDTAKYLPLIEQIRKFLSD